MLLISVCCPSRDDAYEDAENMSMITYSEDGHARKAAAQAVIEITDRLAAAEEEAAALRRALKDARSLTKVRNPHSRLHA